MKINIFIVLLSVFIVSCSNDVDKLVAKQWDECKDKENCIVDFSKIINKDWDTMYYFTNALSFEEINSKLGFYLYKYKDVGDRIIFLKQYSTYCKIVYYKEWFPYPEMKTEEIFIDDVDGMLKVGKLNSKFKVTKQGKLYSLKLIE